MTPSKKPTAKKDEQIVEDLATKVMGWVKDKRQTTGTVVWYKKGDKEKIKQATAETRVWPASGDCWLAWNPLEYWADTMQVVKEMTGTWFQMELRIDQGGCLVAFDQGIKTKGKAGGKDVQRAICLAALKAISTTR